VRVLNPFLHFVLPSIKVSGVVEGEKPENIEKKKEGKLPSPDWGFPWYRTGILDTTH